MKILVLGGAGFIGKVLIEKLINEKYLVHSFDTKLLDLKNPNFKQTQDFKDVARFCKVFESISVRFD